MIEFYKENQRIIKMLRLYSQWNEAQPVASTSIEKKTNKNVWMLILLQFQVAFRIE